MDNMHYHKIMEPLPSPTAPLNDTPAPVVIYVESFRAAGVYDWLMFAVAVLGVVATIAVALLARSAKSSARRTEVEVIASGVEARNTEYMARYSHDPNPPEESQPAASPLSNNSAVPAIDFGVVNDRNQGRYRWKLSNLSSTIVAKNVHISGRTPADESDLQVIYPERMPFDLGPREQVVLLAERTLASPAVTVLVVEWQEEEQGLRFKRQIPLI
ncbi:hypothetical protein CMM_2221 [Clavibacter michiganensis subsp. michiganensis NCPPB 382]|uniref:Uncharacterized protein n=1 Tax=Clavibacter michiganensis subsp. michiganensis (strain NCPPB 382) TaxID=443906 RepID=A5CT66_CLAM3|nr:hypothetical protein CMM_2221 [Clavibacter michiganensis subsp. michiganensis NCPPB 382]